MSWVKANHVKRALREGRPTAGAWLSMCSGISAEIMSRAGFDWLLVDMEHGHGDLQTLLAQLQAIEGSETIPIVRVQWNDAAVIKRVLDLGAYGVMVPWIGGLADVVASPQYATAIGLLLYGAKHRTVKRRPQGHETLIPRLAGRVREMIGQIF